MATENCFERHLSKCDVTHDVKFYLFSASYEIAPLISVCQVVFSIIIFSDMYCYKEHAKVLGNLVSKVTSVSLFFF